jgi:hypothetical protein
LVVDAILGLLGLAVFAACVIVFAAGCTWLVVKLSPSRSSSQQKSES